MAPSQCQPSLGWVCSSPRDSLGEERRERGALSCQSVDFLALGSFVLVALSSWWWLQLHELGTSSGDDNLSAVPVPPIPAASRASFPPGLIPKCLWLTIPAQIQDSALLPLSLSIYIFYFLFFFPTVSKWELN